MMLEQFHFLHPLWLLALLPLIIVFWFAFQKNTDSRAWAKVIDARLLPLLLQGEDKNSNKFVKFLLAILWIITVIALADPVWEKIPRPIFQTNAARVLVLDLSNSMLIDDLKPSRLARARFKIEDILSREEEGQTALVLFAGQAFIATPLTRDTKTIRAMLKVLTPQIMPVQGSRADLGIIKAHQLLKQAGTINGQVLLIADGVSKKPASLKAARDLRNDGHSLSVMAVGTEVGGKLKFRNSNDVLVKMDAEALGNIAKSGGGNYHPITTNNKDIKHLLTAITDNSSLTENNKNNEDFQNREWHSTGPWLVLFLLPFAALAFRRGWLLNVLIASMFIGLGTVPKEVMAAESELEIKWQSFVESLTKNKAQRVNQALINEQYKKARELADDPFARGTAEYKLEDYEEALNNFKQAEGADARYNEGNTLAKLEKYQEAIAAYEQALSQNPSMQDAADNKKAIEDFLKQQQQSGKQSQSSNENQQGNSDSKNDQQNQQSGDSQANQEKQSDSQSANKEGEQQKNQQQENNNKNQFSEANKELEKNKEQDEDDSQTAQNQPSEENQETGENSKSVQKQSPDDKDLADATKDEQQAESNNDQEQLVSAEKEVAEELSKEEKMAAEQWLRRIPDDPGGLLRRKFRHQLEQARREGRAISREEPW